MGLKERLKALLGRKFVSSMLIAVGVVILGLLSLKYVPEQAGIIIPAAFLALAGLGGAGAISQAWQNRATIQNGEKDAGEV